MGAELELDSGGERCCSGISQGFTWSTTVIMKIDLVGASAPRPGDGPERVRRVRGPRRRRAARPAGSPLDTGLRPDPFYPGVAFVAVGLALSLLLVRDTHAHVALEVDVHRTHRPDAQPRERSSGERR